MGKITGLILTIMGIPLLLFGVLILIGLTFAGIIGMAFVTPTIIFASILLLLGIFLIFLGIRDYSSNKRTLNFDGIHGNLHRDNYESNKGVGKKKNIHYISLVIVLVLVSTTILLNVQRWDQTQPRPNSETPDTKDTDINNTMSPLTNGTLIVANDGNTFNSTNPDITIDSKSSSKFVVFNQDSTLHNFHIDSLDIQSPILKEGESYGFVMQGAEPGVYEYLCTIHPNKMRGIWTVK